MDRSKINSFPVGMLAGFIFPLLAYLLTRHTVVVEHIMPDKPTGLYIIAVALNMIGVWAAYRNAYGGLGSGLVFSTFSCMLLAVFTRTIVI